mmetsp:Transcript_5015/g.8177  ORF Transcript_5015/g.8177 Transcript_5015/m.8177 type:complete len:223 (-) Transcript_5015:2386-3054(-)
MCESSCKSAKVAFPTSSKRPANLKRCASGDCRTCAWGPCLSSGGVSSCSSKVFGMAPIGESGLAVVVVLLVHEALSRVHIEDCWFSSADCRAHMEDCVFCSAHPATLSCFTLTSSSFFAVGALFGARVHANQFKNLSIQHLPSISTWSKDSTVVSETFFETSTTFQFESICSKRLSPLPLRYHTTHPTIRLPNKSAPSTPIIAPATLPPPSAVSIEAILFGV